MPDITHPGDMASNAAHKTGNVFTKKLGPLPLWAWGLGAAVIIGLLLRHRANASASQSSAGPLSATVAPTSDASVGSNPNDVLSGQLTDLQGSVGALSQQVQMLQPVAGAPTTQPQNANPVGASVEDTLLGRTPGSTAAGDVSGATYWGQRIQSGGILSAFQQIETSPEASQFAASNPQGFINAQYQELLGRNADASGAAYWTSVLSGPGGLQNEVTQFAKAAQTENKNLK